MDLSEVVPHWGIIVAAVPVALAILGTIAEFTPWKWDNKAIIVIRKIWAVIPVGNRNVKDMGKGKS